MQQVIITRGISNSGKTTWAVEWLAAEPNRARVNQDIIREHLFGANTDYSDKQERTVAAVQNKLIEGFLAEGRDVVVDNTNLSEKKIEVIEKLAKKHGAEFKIKAFHVSLAEAIERNASRARQGKGVDVPTGIIENMHQHITERPLPERFVPYLMA